MSKVLETPVWLRRRFMTVARIDRRAAIRSTGRGRARLVKVLVGRGGSLC